MKHSFIAVLAAFACIAPLVFMISCSDSTTETPTAVELRMVASSGGEDFYPFDEPPTLLRYRAPEYPSTVRRENIEATVLVMLTLDETGDIESVEILNGTDSSFEPSALEAAHRCRFKPATLAGKPTKSRIAIPMRFRPTS
jgi:TonB family protein